MPNNKVAQPSNSLPMISGTKLLDINETTEKKILIVDDQIFNIQALEAILLHKFNISINSIDRCLNGEEALDLITVDIERNQSTFIKEEEELTEFDPELIPSTYSLILMDCNMPFMDGFECSRRIREKFGQLLGIDTIQQPIITAVTGHVESKYIKKCFDHGMNQVLSKPIDQAALLSAVTKAGITTKKEIEEFQRQKAEKLAKFKM